MKTTTLGIAIGTAIAALGLAITAVPEAKAGDVYWNNNGGGGVVINRGTTYGPRGYYNYGPNYYLCLLYTSPSPRDRQKSRMPSSA